MISSQTRNMVRDFQNPQRTSFQRLTSTMGENTSSKTKAASAAISEGLMECYGRPSQFTIVAALKNLIEHPPQNAESCSMRHSFKSLFLLVAVKLKKIVKIFCSSSGIRIFSSSGNSSAPCARELDALNLAGSFQIVKPFKSSPKDTWWALQQVFKLKSSICSCQFQETEIIWMFRCNSTLSDMGVPSRQN